MAGVEPEQVGTVPVRVQVVDDNPRIADLAVPTYLPVDDVAQRIARDLGLGAWWADGTRRGFALRARGRVLGPTERLVDVGVVPYELLHLLPEPRPGDPVIERPLGVTLPVREPVSGWSVVGRAAALALWCALLFLAAPAAGRADVWLGGVGLAWWSLNLSHGAAAHRAAVSWRAISLLVIGVAGAAPGVRLWDVASALGAREGAVWLALYGLGAAIGWLVGLLVWLGPVAAPVRPVAEGTVAAVVAHGASCGICGGAVSASVMEGCGHGCGKVFHRGCARARTAVAQGAGCALCGGPIPGRA
jgi:hypothetical protein